MSKLTKFPPRTPSRNAYHEQSLYALKDITSDSFGVIFEATNDDAAKRSIQQHQRLEPNTLFSMYPDDYQLWRIGVFDRNSGAVKPDQEYLCAASALAPLTKSAD